ncbi:MAG: hypothetical protein QXS74_07585 [Nitrososphaeria archaeon]
MDDATKIVNEYSRLLKDFSIESNYQLSIVVKEILKEIKPIAIYLIGSFGRDEGSIRVLKSGSVVPIRDYDVLIVLNKRVASEKIRKVMERVNTMLGFTSPNFRNFKFQGFCVWVTQATLKEISSAPFLKFYELRESSKLLWGQDVRRLVKVKLSELLKYNFVLILFSKIHGLLGLLALNFLRENRNDEMLDLIYECLKIYVEIGTCLSLLTGKYAPSFIERCLEVSKNFDVYFRDLQEKIPDLSCMISYCAYRRLIIDDDYLCAVRLKEFFLKTRDDLKVILNYFIKEVYGVNLTLKELNTKVVEEVIGSYLMSKFGYLPKFFVKLVTQVYLRYVCLKFLIEGWKNGYRIRLRTLFYRQSNIMMRLWLLGLRVLDSVKQDLTIDAEILSETLRELDKIIDLSQLRKYWIKASPNIVFSCIKEIIVKLMDMADKIFHRKDY